MCIKRMKRFTGITRISTIVSYPEAGSFKDKSKGNWRLESPVAAGVTEAQGQTSHSRGEEAAPEACRGA